MARGDPRFKGGTGFALECARRWQWPFRNSDRTNIQHARGPGTTFIMEFRAYKLDLKRATALLETWFEATSDLPNEPFSAWIMNGSEVTVVSSLLVRASKYGW